MLLALTVIFGAFAAGTSIAMLYRPSGQPATRRDRIITIVNLVSTIAMVTLLAIHALSN
ncbi:hypothetical protein [Kibdelosporangium aridum]|uniref:hypothetical protein n=1 Tax=Kibdelosporangium aridum TaxID=2030 RepID=UPI000ACA7786|nr:hypothetical protein [Kibdelosporangium aridum]